MIEKITEKLDAIEVANATKIAEAVETVKTELTEKIVALEAKLSEVQAPAVVSTPAKTVRQDVNRMVKEQLAAFAKSDSRIQKEIKLFESEDQYAAYLKETGSTLTGGGAGIGGRTLYDPVFHALRLANPMRGASRIVSTEASIYQFRAKVGNAGAAWGYPVNNNLAATTEAMNIWQLVLQDINVQFPVRTAALDDIDGLDSNIVDDMLVEFSQQEGLSMILNDDQAGSTTTAYGGTSGLRGLNYYPGANGTYTGGTISTAAFGTSGTASTDGLSSIATYDQLTSNGNGVVNNVTYKDCVNFIYSLPQQYWTPSAKWIINPLMLAAIRGLTDENGRPIYVDGLARNDGIVGTLLGFDVVVNSYLSQPCSTTQAVDQYPMYFGDWTRGHTIVDRLSMIMRRYDQTQPGYINYYGEKRLACSVVDPFAIIRYRSTPAD
ncbi:major_cap_HK97, phage major capsid protein, HK97 family [uncultured Caudovirales phage]|uniref:Major_cap_HK97, phage major capsid protein, HK97 family n=1 Tax=uncultured Caudovirales phage TaxID=2100421 RepID=A0A6J5N0Q7_9CAUD|nr:major_cap_HK97, phage major capsid protein, HK97 family [uncultured Caudovirales phage]